MFSIGELHVLPGTQQVLAGFSLSLDTFLARHKEGDWGDIHCRTWADNSFHAARGWGSLYSAYQLPSDKYLWIVTSPNWRVTLVGIDRFNS